MNTTLIRFLVQLRNGFLFNKKSISLNINSQYLNVMEILYIEGFLQTIKIDASRARYIISLRFFEQQPLIHKLKLFSIPSQNCFISFQELSFLQDRNIFLLLSTSKGLLTLFHCKK